MYPVLFRIGDFEITSFGVLVAVAAAVGLWLFERERRRSGLPDNAVDGVAIWEIPANDVDHVTIFFNGLSGETHEVENPVTQEKVYLRRTLQIDYQTPGSVEQQPRKPWLFKGEEWVVR